MRISRIRKWLGASALFLALCVGSGLVLAQDPPGDPAEKPAGAGEGEGDDEGDGDGTGTGGQNALEVKPNLTVEQMRAEGTALITEMRSLLKRVVEIRKTAKKRKDAVKVQCVNDKLLAIKGFIKVAEARSTDMDQEITDGNVGEAFDAYTDIKLSHESVTTLAAEAEQCIGEDLTYLGPSETEVDVEGDEEDLDSEEPNLPDVEQPPVQSDFMP